MRTITWRAWSGLVVAGLAQDVTVSQSPTQLGSAFLVEATAMKGVTVDKIEAVVMTALRTLAKTPPGTAEMERLKVPREMASRYLNEGFSGGEKKRVEILQMAMLKPTIAVLDETDSGLDIDALKIVAGGVKELVGPNMGAVVITHYQRILNYIEPDYVHVFVDGRIVEEGGPELAHKLEAEGYEAFMPAVAAGGGE